MEFLPDLVKVHSLKDDSLVVVGKVNHNKRFYSFSHFVPKYPSNALLSESNSNMQLMHERYGHLDFRYLQQLCTNHMVKGLPQIDFSKSECSIDLVDMHPEGKLQRGKSSRETGVLQMVHMVLAGPFAFNQGRYILTLVDDFSRFTWVYFLHNKNEVLDKFLDFKTHVEQNSRKAIKVLHMDNGSMYVNRRLMDFCRHEAIDLQTPATFSPHKIDVQSLRI